MNSIRLLALACFVFVASAAQAVVAAPQNNRLAIAEQCPAFHADSQHDKDVKAARFPAMSEKVFADTMRTCNDPNWRQKEHFRKLSGIKSPGTQVTEVTFRPQREFSAADDAQLDALLARKSIQVLGEPQAGYDGYRGSTKGHMPVPRGCAERKVHDDRLHRTFVRVTCR